jgi:hypothetical protein
MNAPSIISFSEMETRVLGLKFGRYNTACIDSEQLKQGIQVGKFDVVRVKTDCSDEFAAMKLDQTGYASFFNGGVRRYRVNCFEADLPPFTQPDVNFELYLGQHQEILEEIMNESCGDYPLGYYRTPGLHGRINKQMESKCLFDFYAHYNNNSLFENSYLWFMKLGNEYVGFIALNVYRDKDIVDSTDSTLAGFLKSHQGMGLFPNILRHIRQFCRDINITYFCCGARNENMFSQKAFEKDFMKCEGVEYIFHMVPMLSAAKLSS